MTNLDAQMILVWGLILLAYVVPPVLRRYGYDKTDGMFNSYILGMYLLMMATGATISFIISTALN
jgi:hypothetical protein